MKRLLRNNSFLCLKYKHKTKSEILFAPFIKKIHYRWHTIGKDIYDNISTFKETIYKDYRKVTPCVQWPDPALVLHSENWFSSSCSGDSIFSLSVWSTTAHWLQIHLFWISVSAHSENLHTVPAVRYQREKKVSFMSLTPRFVLLYHFPHRRLSLQASHFINQHLLGKIFPKPFV